MRAEQRGSSNLVRHETVNSTTNLIPRASQLVSELHDQMISPASSTGEAVIDAGIPACWNLTTDHQTITTGD
jgi:hypothetical protein